VPTGGHSENIHTRQILITNSITRGNATNMCDRCKRRVICCSDGYTRSIPTCGYGTRCPHAPRRHFCPTHHKTRTKPIQKICVEEQTWQTNVVCKIKKSTVWAITGSTSILETPI